MQFPVLVLCAIFARLSRPVLAEHEKADNVDQKASNVDKKAENLKAFFVKFDIDGDSKLSDAELGGLVMSFDPNSDGQFSEAEAFKVFKANLPDHKLKKKQVRALLQQILSVIDPDGDFKDFQLGALAKFLDADKNGIVAVEEAVAAFGEKLKAMHDEL